METVKQKEVKDYYDKYTGRQKRSGVNYRHYSIFLGALEAGLKKNHKMLEIGCGIGTATSLFSKYLKRGGIVATDISEESIEIARRDFAKQKHVEFHVTDMKEWSVDKKFDFVLFPDVLEHIPMDQHANIFRIVKEHTHEDSTILINIPHPKFLDYARIHRPEDLQIIDQSLPSDSLVNLAYQNDFYLEQFRSYCLFHEEPDAQMIIFKRNKARKKATKKGKFEKILQKQLIKLKYWTATI